MPPVTIRISRAAHATLRRLADETNEPMAQVLEQAVDAYRRQRFLKGLNDDFAALRNDPAAWAAELDERAAWGASSGSARPLSSGTDHARSCE